MPLHPLLVHFPIAFWLLGALVVTAGWWRGRETWWQAGWYVLILAAATALPAVITGQNDFVPLAETHNPVLWRHRDMGNLLPWVMGVVVLAYLHDRFARKAAGVPRSVLVVCVLGVAWMVAYAAHLGGRTVYEEGMGVGLPDVQKKMKISVAPPWSF